MISSARSSTLWIVEREQRSSRRSPPTTVPGFFVIFFRITFTHLWRLHLRKINSHQITTKACHASGNSNHEQYHQICFRLYGTFPDEVDCGVFWKCQDGKPNKYNCPPGLAYDSVVCST